MPVVSNIDEVMDRIEKAIDSFGFDSEGREGNLGEDIARVAATGIQDRSLHEQRGATGDWPRNDPEYLAWKQAHLGSSLINFATGLMLSMGSMLAGVRVTHKILRLKYGSGQTSGQSQAPGVFSPRGASSGRTDIQKATYAHQQDRGFWELDDNINHKIGERMQGGLHEHLERELG